MPDCKINYQLSFVASLKHKAFNLHQQHSKAGLFHSYNTMRRMRRIDIKKPDNLLHWRNQQAKATYEIRCQLALSSTSTWMSKILTYNLAIVRYFVEGHSHPMNQTHIQQSFHWNPFDSPRVNGQAKPVSVLRKWGSKSFIVVVVVFS